MWERPKIRIEYALVPVGILAVGIALAWSSDEPVATSEAVWPDHIVSRFHASCIQEVEKRSPAIQEVVCSCQLAEVKRWLQPSDMPIHLAAVEGRKGWTEVDEFRNALSKTEQEAFLKRINQLRESLLPTCAKVGFDAGLTKQDVQ